MINYKFGDWIIISKVETTETIGKTKKYGITWVCRCKCGFERNFTTSYINTNKATCCDQCKFESRLNEDKDVCKKYLNTKHGTWKVISYSGKNKYGSRVWLCRCDCGKEKTFITSYLSGNGKVSAGACKNCRLKLSEIENRIFYIPNRFWYKFTNTSMRRNISVEITKDEANDVYLKQNKKCAYTNMDLYFTKFTTNFNRYTNASIDRIDSSKPYCLDNIQWVYKKINLMKSSHSSEEFIRLCNMVTQNNKI